MLFGILGGNWTPTQTLMLIVAFGLAILIALVIHEYAHAWAALKQGDHTAKFAGRLTLNPAKHIEPLGLLCFCIVGFGWAKPVPVNPFNYRNFKRGNFWVSIAGVLMNLILGFIFSLGLFITWNYGSINGAFDSIYIWGLYHFFLFGMVVNLSLMIFNLLPIPPLDGYNLLRSFTKPNNGFMFFMRNNAMIVLILVILFGGYFIMSVRAFFETTFLNFWGMVWGLF